MRLARPTLLAALVLAALASGSGRAPAAVPACTITGTPRADALIGTPGRDVICGLGGNDLIDGLSGADIIRGGAGNDALQGGAGRDVIEGGTGNDSLFAFDGTADRLDGGPGLDTAGIDGLDAHVRNVERKF